jgi:hypothetical protein
MWEGTEDELEELGKVFVEHYQQILTQKIYPYGNPNIKGMGNKFATGNLYNSFKSKVVSTSDGLQLQISYADYYKNVNFGRKPGGKKVPIKALIEWIKVRGLKKRDAKGRFAKGGIRSLAFAIQTNIHKFGIRRANLFDKAYDSLEEVLENPPAFLQEQFTQLYNAIGRDVENFIQNTITEEIESIKK